MAKKEKIQLQRSDDFCDVDAALNDAMQTLDETNARINELLDQYRPKPDAGDGVEANWAEEADPDDLGEEEGLAAGAEHGGAAPSETP